MSGPPSHAAASPRVLAATPAHLAGFALAYVAAAALARWPALEPGLSATLWPPSGLYLAVLLLAERRDWQGYVQVAFLVDAAVEVLMYDYGVPVGLCVALGNTLEALTGAYLVQGWCATPFRFHGPRDVLGLTLLGAVLGPVVGATVGATTLLVAGVQPFGAVWPLWWVSDAVGVLIAAPLVLVGLEGGAPPWRGTGRARSIEAALLSLTLVVVDGIVFTSGLPIAYLTLSPLLWAALRFGIPGAVLGMTVLTAMAIGHTALGLGPFAAPHTTSPEQRVQLVQWFLGIAAVSTYVLAALIHQRREVLEGLTQAKAELEERGQALHVSQERLRAFLQNSAVIAWMKDAEGRHVYLSENLEKRFELRFKDWWGRTDYELWPRPMAEECRRNDRSVLTDGRPLESIEEAMHRDGSRSYWLVRKFLFQDAGGQSYVGGLGVDVTARQRAEAELRETDRRKDEFLAMLSHELHDSLAPIRNLLQVLRRPGGVAGAEARGLYETMERQVDHLVRVVDDVLDVSRICHGTIELRREAVDLSAVLRNAVEMARSAIEAAGQRLEITLPPEPLVIEADPVRLAQVFAKLLNNAAQFTEPGGRIALLARRAGQEARVSVSDTGIGIPAEMLERVFEPYTQVGRHRAQGGLGIGLTLVRRVVELHGGRVEARSPGLGQGSELTVRLPLPVGVAGSAVEPGPSSRLSPRRILVVDDNRDSADSLGTLVQALGAEVRIAYDGPTALEAVADFRPEVVLLDLGMPGMDGLEIARRLRERPEGRDFTLIAMTGWGQEADHRGGREAGFDHHLVKPIAIEDLQGVLGDGEGRERA